MDTAAASKAAKQVFVAFMVTLLALGAVLAYRQNAIQAEMRDQHDMVQYSLQTTISNVINIGKMATNTAMSMADIGNLTTNTAVAMTDAVRAVMVIASDGEIKPPADGMRMGPAESHIRTIVETKLGIRRQEVAEMSNRLAGIEHRLTDIDTGINNTSNRLGALIGRVDNMFSEGGDVNTYIRAKTAMLAKTNDVKDLTDRLAQIEALGIRSKAGKSDTNTAVLQKAGEIRNSGESAMVVLANTRKGFPSTKGGIWRGKPKQLTVNYKVAFLAPQGFKNAQGENRVLSEKDFQAFEAANLGLMKDLAEMRGNEAKRLGQLTTALTEALSGYLKKNPLPKSVKFMGAEALPAPSPTTATGATP